MQSLGNVELYENRRIEKFVSNDESLILEDNQYGQLNDEKCKKFMEFLMQHTKDFVKPMSATQVFEEFKKRENSSTHSSMYFER